jgi:hypothetical protein
MSDLEARQGDKERERQGDSAPAAPVSLAPCRPFSLSPSAASGTDAFLDRVRAVNPFLDNRVNAPAADMPDVEGIHQGAFLRLTELASQALAARRGVGVLVWGQAGIGKSHLLARLGRWAASAANGCASGVAALGPGDRACFVYLHNLQAAPEHLPRSLLHAVVRILTGGRSNAFAATPLFRLAHAGLLEAAGPGFVSWDRLRRAFTAWVDRLAAGGLPEAVPPDRDVFDVLYRFFCSAYRRTRGEEDGREAVLAVRWLSGQALDPDEARLLGLPPPLRLDEPVALADNQQVKQVFVALARLAAAAGQPFVLAFDQVDNLDAEQMSALARFLEALLDSAPNLLAVTAGIQTTLLPWHEQGVIPDSAWDRLAQFELLLQRLTPAEGLAIVQARLDNFLAPFADLQAVAAHRRADPLFPLGAAWRERFIQDKVDLRPRDVVNWAREGWRQQQEALAQEGGAVWLADWPCGAGETPVSPTSQRGALLSEEELIDRKVDEKVAEHRDGRLREPGALPPDADHLAGLLFGLLEQCRDADHLGGVQDVVRLPAPRRGTRPTYDLTVLQTRPEGGPPWRTGVVIVTAPNAISVAGFLRRLWEDSRPLDRVVLVTDERVGLPLGGRGHEYLQELRRGRRFRAVELALREYAELEALHQVARRARAGDLEIEPRAGQVRPVLEREVLESNRRRGRYLASHLLAALLETPQPEPATPGGKMS